MSTVTQFPQPSDIRSAVAAEVRAWMARRGVSQVALSTAVGIGQSQISKRLNAKIPFDIDELDRIARFLGTDVVTLLGGASGNHGPGGGVSMATQRYTHSIAA